VKKLISETAEPDKAATMPLSRAGTLKAGETDFFTNKGQVSNLLVFLLFCALTILLFLLVIVQAIIPGLLPLPMMIASIILLASGLSATGYRLFSISQSAKYQAITLIQQQNLIGKMAEDIARMRDRQKNLRRAHREEQLRAEEAKISKAAFLAHLSHDIRTPLNHIIGFADLISHQTFGPLGDKRYGEYVRDIKQSGERLLSDIAGILELSELQSGQKILSIEKIMVDEMLRDIDRKFGSRAKRCGINLDVDCWCDAVLFADRIGIERIIGNLVDNALRFTEKGGQVRIGAWVADEGIIFEVTDTGIGMTKNKLAKIFEPFLLGDASKSRKIANGGSREGSEAGSGVSSSAGAGLGLAIARSIAELSGGELAIDSMAGIGTTVAICLPLNLENQNIAVQAA